MFKNKKTFNKPVSEFKTKVLFIDTVTRVTAGGKIRRFRAVVAIGDEKGRIGIGIAKGLDVAQAKTKAENDAKKNMIKIILLNETIPHEVFAKFGAAKILLKPQKSGRGIIAGGVVRSICFLSGIKNISSKIIGRTTNKLTNAKATINALKMLKKPKGQNSKPETESVKLETTV